MKTQLLHSQNFAIDAAQYILARAREALAERGLFRLGLTGGRSPRAVHQALIEQAGDLPWNKVLLTFGDERCVPPDHEDSNFRVAKESLFDPAGISESSVFRMRGESDPEEAARDYAARLAAVAARFQEPRYAHDLLLLGVGEDGHIASLFPGSPALQETERHVVSVIGPKPPPQRLTLTFPIIDAARHVLFLVPDPAKRDLVEAIIAGSTGHPAGKVQPREQATWLVGW